MNLSGGIARPVTELYSVDLNLIIIKIVLIESQESNNLKEYVDCKQYIFNKMSIRLTSFGLILSKLKTEIKRG